MNVLAAIAGVAVGELVAFGLWACWVSSAPAPAVDPIDVHYRQLLQLNEELTLCMIEVYELAGDPNTPDEVWMTYVDCQLELTDMRDALSRELTDGD